MAPSDYDSSMLRHELQESVSAAAAAEIDQYDDIAAHETLTTKYRLVMDALFALGGIERTDICAKAKRMVEGRIWELRERARGVPRDQVRIPHSLWYRVAQEHGYTAGYGQTRAERQESGADPVTIAPQPPRRRDAPSWAARNARYIEAFSALAASMNVVAEWLERAGPFDEHVEAEHREMVVAMAAAFRRNVQELASARVLVPTNAQPLAVRTIISALGVDAGVRQFFTSVKEMKTFRAREAGQKKFLDMRSVLSILKRSPHSLQVALEFAGPTEAQWWGFHGQRCDGCGHWRMVHDEGTTDTLYCISCKARAPRRPFVYCPKCHYRIEDYAGSRDACPHCRMAIKIPEGVE